MPSPDSAQQVFFDLKRRLSRILTRNGAKPFRPARVELEVWSA